MWPSHLHNTQGGTNKLKVTLLGWEQGWGVNVAIAIYTPSTSKGQVNVIIPQTSVLVQQGRHVGEACGQITSTPVPEEGQPYGEHDVPLLLASWRRRAIWSMTCCIMYTLQCADLWFPSCILLSMSNASGFSKSRMSISSGHVQMGPMVVPPKVPMSQTLSHFHKGGSIVSTILNG